MLEAWLVEKPFFFFSHSVRVSRNSEVNTGIASKSLCCEMASVRHLLQKAVGTLLLPPSLLPACALCVYISKTVFGAAFSPRCMSSALPSTSRAARAVCGHGSWALPVVCAIWRGKAHPSGGERPLLLLPAQRIPTDERKAGAIRL